MSALTPETEVSLIGMRFHVCVGILPHEHETAQSLEADVVVRHARDRAVLDYGELYDLTAQTIAADARTYLEPLAEAIAARILLLEGVHWCRVALRKPQVALGGPLQFAQVSVERTRA